MQVSINQVQAGIVKFLDTQLIPHFDGWQKIGLGAGMALIIKNLPNVLNGLKSNKVIAMLGIIDDDMNVEIDALHDAVCDYFSDAGEYIDVPIVGRIKFTRQDIETLYTYIKEA